MPGHLLLGVQVAGGAHGHDDRAGIREPQGEPAAVGQQGLVDLRHQLHRHGQALVVGHGLQPVAPGQGLQDGGIRHPGLQQRACRVVAPGQGGGQGAGGGLPGVLGQGGVGLRQSLGAGLVSGHC